MAPVLAKISNASGGPVDVSMTGGKKFCISNGETVNADSNIENVSKIKKHEKEDHGYLLKYDGNYNIMLNDTLGKNNGVEYSSIHIKGSDENVNIDILQDHLKIWCTSKDLGIYQADKSIIYYKSVIATHAKDGGIIVNGFEGFVEQGPTASASKTD